VRHGESAWIAEGRFQGQGDPPLSDVGVAQAAAVAARLAAPDASPALPVPAHAPDAIWYSPLLRAAQTAEAIHEARGRDTPLRPLDTLKELAQGEWEGVTHDEVRSRWPAELAAWRDDPTRNHAPGGESLAAAMLRARSARATILGESDGAALSAAAGTHGAPAEPVLGYERTFGGDDRPGWVIIVAHDGILRLLMFDLLDIGLDHFWSFPLALASVTVLDVGAGVVRLRAHNLEEHNLALSRAPTEPPD
jgi:broad specificity phosphatase PhoE